MKELLLDEKRHEDKVQSVTENTQEERNLIVRCVRRLGHSSSEATLDQEFKFFRVPQIEGFIGYRLESNCAIVFGDPICPTHEKERLALAFHEFCKNHKMSCTYIIVSKKFAKWAIENISNVMIEIGEELIYDPQKDPKEGIGNRLRNKVNHAQHLGLIVEEYLKPDLNIEEAILKVGSDWLKARKGPQIYLGNLNFFADRTGKRWFYVKEGEKIIGMSMLCKLEAHKGWLLKFLITVPYAPRGTSELLMVSILEKLKEENCRFLTYGMVPGEQLGEIIGLGRLSTWMARGTFKLVKWLFKLNQRKTYWQKFHPKTEPAYLLFYGPNMGLSEFISLMKALNINL